MAKMQRSSWVIGGQWALLLLWLGYAGWASAGQQPLPSNDGIRHLGVVTCAGSTCHGATRPFKSSTVLQNEFFTWKRKDAHSGAYKTLKTEASARIARNLGLESAQSAQICLDCHADAAPANRRGRRFQLSDGVGCEACHGGSEKYLGPHVSGASSHNNNVNLGLYPTEQPMARARLCLSCHLGNDKQLATHRIMGAGHPQLRFELDTYTATQPAHYRVDRDYKRRKKVYSGVQTWAIGQAMAVQQYLQNLTNPKYQNSALFPELSFFDCHACHQSMDNPNWEPRESTGLGPGVVRLHDANMLMLGQLLMRMDTNLAQRFKQQARALHTASTVGKAALQTAAKALANTSEQAAQSIAKHAFADSDIQALLLGLLDAATTSELRDYAAAEQTVMAVDALLHSLKDSGALSSQRFKQLDALRKQATQPLKNASSYQADDYRAAMQALLQAWQQQ